MVGGIYYRDRDQMFVGSLWKKTWIRPLQNKAWNTADAATVMQMTLSSWGRSLTVANFVACKTDKRTCGHGNRIFLMRFCWTKEKKKERKKERKKKKRIFKERRKLFLVRLKMFGSFVFVTPRYHCIPIALRSRLTKLQPKAECRRVGISRQRGRWEGEFSKARVWFIRGKRGRVL